jgi:hypothetical protein
MSHFLCECGATIRHVDSPCEELYLLVADTDRQTLVDQIAEVAHEEHFSDHITGALVDIAVAAYKCSVCGRLLVFWNGTAKPYTSYARERSG